MRKAVWASWFCGAMVFQAAACPICDSETGREVREGIFGPAFGTNLLLLLAPFPLLFGLIYVVCRWLPDAAKNRKDFYEQR